MRVRVGLLPLEDAVLCQNSSGRQECGFGELIQRSDGVVGMVDHVEASVYDVGCCWRKAMAPRFMLQLMQMIFALVRNLFANRADLAIEIRGQTL